MFPQFFEKKEFIGDVLAMDNREVAHKIDQYMHEFFAMWFTSGKWTKFADDVIKWLPDDKKSNEFVLRIIAIGKLLELVIHTDDLHGELLDLLKRCGEKGILKVAIR